MNALGGVDVVTIDDLSGTDVTGVNVDLAATLGGTAGDGAVDRVVVNGTNRDDTINVSGNSSGVTSAACADGRGLHPGAHRPARRSTASAATTPSRRSGLAARAIALASTAAPETTCSPAARASRR